MRKWFASCTSKGTLSKNIERVVKIPTANRENVRVLHFGDPSVLVHDLSCLNKIGSVGRGAKFTINPTNMKTWVKKVETEK